MKTYLLTLLVLASMALSQTAYLRSDWLPRWTDADKDCQDTRVEVLLRESLVPAAADGTGCKVLSGLWYCRYTGMLVTDPSMLDIDHVVPLQNAHVSGGYLWPTFKRQAYANDLSSPYFLIAVSKSANRRKGSQPPNLWMPSNGLFHCGYLRTWLETKRRWSLRMSAPESLYISRAISSCP